MKPRFEINESIVYAAEGWPWYMGKAYPLRPGDQGFKLQEQTLCLQGYHI